MSSEDAARKYSVSITWVYNLKKQRKETGSIEPKIYQPGPKRKLAPYEQEIRQFVADHPDATLVDLHAMPPNNIDETLQKSEVSGNNCKSSSTSKNLFSSMKLGRKRT